MPKNSSSTNLRPARGRPSNRGKGENSRIAILDATLICIARNGFNGATHRAIADQAGVTLSLTTYFFASREDLLRQAFDHYAERTLQGTEQWISDIDAYLKSITPWRRSDIKIRRQVKDALAAQISEFIARESPEKALGSAIEVSYMFAYLQPLELRQRVKAYRDRLVSMIAQQMAQIGIADTQINASLLLGTIHRLEYECLNQELRPTKLEVRDEIAQLLALMMRV